MAEDEMAHLCRHCENITFILSGSITLPFTVVELADEGGCQFFQVILQKYPIENTDFASRRPMLVLNCTETGGVTFRWVDSGTALPDSCDLWIDEFSMFARKGSLAFVDLKREPLNSTPGSMRSFCTIRSWIRECDEKHAGCHTFRKTLSGQQGPARLIEVGVEGSERVCIREALFDGTEQYAALSYCWGHDQESKTKDSNIKQRCEGFALKDLSKTIQDAISTTRKLGLQYLWVDAICIVQDNKADYNQELPKMDQIYSGAVITISAARVERADESFLRDRVLCETYGSICRVKYRRSSESASNVRSAFLSATRLDITYQDPIDSRGWTFQECLRSFRVLRFGRKQTVWECPADTFVDGGENSFHDTSSNPLFTGKVTDSIFPYSLDDESSTAKEALNRALGNWQTLVMDYTGRNLSQSADRLPAFAAIAKAFGSLMQVDSDQYIAGLWKFDICMQLRWRRPDDMAVNKWCNKRHGPTWSWASLEGPVIFDHPRLPSSVVTLRAVREDDWKTRWKLVDFKYGEVEFAQLMVRGFLRLSNWKDGLFVGVRFDIGEFDVLPLHAYWDSDEAKPLNVWCLEIVTSSSSISDSTSSGLLLTHSAGIIFKRLGYFEFHHSKYRSEPVNAALDRRGLPPNSNWFYNGGYEIVCLE